MIPALLLVVASAEASNLVFGDATPVDPNADLVTALRLADVDGDGAVDAVAALLDDVVWYPNLGDGRFGPPVPVGAVPDTWTVTTADLDGDDDLDVLVGATDTAVWFENLGVGVFGAQHPLASPVGRISAIAADDLDGDALPDAIVGADDARTVTVYRNGGSGTFDTGATRCTACDVSGLSTADIDADGVADLVVAAGTDVSVYLATGIGIVLTNTAAGAITAEPADLDGDGDPDVLVATWIDDSVSWFENSGIGTFGVAQVLTGDATGAAVGADLDTDGDTDVAVIVRDGLSWLENDGALGFGVARPLATGLLYPQGLGVADVDADGAPDLLASSWANEAVVAFRNRGPDTDDDGLPDLEELTTDPLAADSDGDGRSDGDELPAGTDPLLPDTDADGTLDAADVCAGASDASDVDGDGIPDPCEPPLFSAALPIGGGAGDVSALPVDVDSDGDLDVVVSSPQGDLVSWFPNIGPAGFGAAIAVTSQAGPLALATGDLDGDGDPDVVVGGGAAVAWYRNDGGAFVAGSVLSHTIDQPRALAAVDVDSDGDTDVLVVSEVDDTVTRFENTGGGTFASGVVVDGALSVVGEVGAADLAGDPTPETYAGSLAGVIRWYDDTDDDRVVTADLLGLRRIRPLDVDSDGDLDLAAITTLTSGHDGALVRFENRGDGFFGPAEILDEGHPLFGLDVGDLDGDGTPDLVAAGEDGVIGFPQHRAPFVVALPPGLPYTVALADLDGDGDPDVLLGSDAPAGVVWYRNEGPDTDDDGLSDGAELDGVSDPLDPDSDDDGLSDGEEDVWDTDPRNPDSDGDGLFDGTEVTDLGTDPTLGDTDGDGQLDGADPCPVDAPDDTDGDGICDQTDRCPGFDDADDTDGDGISDGCAPVGFYDQGTLIVTAYPNIASLGTADLDGDGDTDLLHADGVGVVWYANLVAVFGGPQRIGNPAGWTFDVAVADVDGDADLDVTAADFADDWIRWYDNDGAGAFGPAQPVDTDIHAVQGLAFGDIDGDGDPDLMSGGGYDLGPIGWYPNVGAGFGPRELLFPGTTGRFWLAAGDLDGDGDDDPLATWNAGPIGWVANQGGTFGPEQPIGTRIVATAVIPVDLDGDGDLDVVAAYPLYPDLRSPVWYENLGGSFGPERLLDGNLGGAEFLAVADLDGDGDPDLVAAPGGPFGHLEWYQNLGGGLFSAAEIPTGDGRPVGVVSTDMDVDGDLDLLVALTYGNPYTTEIVWFQNTGRPVDDTGVPPDPCPDVDGDGVCADEDCDDADPTVFPGAPERCDGRDNGCTGDVPDEDADVDGDGFSVCAEDCDDTDPAVNPEAGEVCNGLDDDCDGTVDPDCADTPSKPPSDGCGCSTSAGMPGLLLVLVGGLVLRRRAAPVLIAGCSAGADRELAQQPIDDQDIVAVFPPDGALHLVGDVPVEIVLGASASGTTPDVSVTRDGVASDDPCTIVFGGTVADCGSIPVTAGDDVRIDVTAGGTTTTVTSAGHLPVEGLGWDLLDGMRFETLGSGGEAVTLANSFLGQGHSFAALDGFDGSAGAWTLVAGESVVQDDGTHAIAIPGFVFVLPVTVGADGALEGTASSAWLPTYLSGTTIHLLLLDAHVTGTVAGSALTDVVLTAHLPAVTLEELAAPLGLLGNELLDVINLDVDRDGDGTNDAATVRLEGTPAPAVLGAWD